MTPEAVILPILGGVIAALFGLAGLAPYLPGRVMPAATAGLCGLVAMVALVASLSGGSAVMAAPVGLGLLSGTVALDPLASWFLLALAVCGLASAGIAETRTLPALLAAGMLAVIAADAGVVLVGLGGFTLLRRPSRVSALGMLLVAGGLVVLSAGTGAAYGAIRLSPPEGVRAGMVLALTLAGLVLIAAPGAWRRSHVLVPIVGSYVLCRVLLDLSGAATPAWWGAPVVVLGAALACGGAVVAIRADTLPSAMAALVASQAGWIVAGAGLVAIARAADLLPLATLAGGGTMLHVLGLAVFGSLGALAVAAASRGAGSDRLDRLGGLATRMTATAAAALVAGGSLALLPPSAGFASAWMLLQAAFAATRLGGVLLHFVVALTALSLIAASGLATAAVIRIAGLAFLGRPRTPRAAAAEQASRPDRATMAAAAAVCLALGLFPGLAVRLAEPAQQMLTRARLEGQAGWAGLQTQQALPGYAPLAVAVLVLAGFAALVLLARRFPGTQVVRGWEDGFAEPPPWLPFGDPATQATPLALASMLDLTRIPALTTPWRLPVTLRLGVAWPRVAPAAALLGLPVLLGLPALLGLAVLLILAVQVFGPP